MVLLVLKWEQEKGALGRGEGGGGGYTNTGRREKGRWKKKKGKLFGCNAFGEESGEAGLFFVIMTN